MVGHPTEKRSRHAVDDETDDNAKPSAGMVSQRMDTGTLSIAKSRATGASCAVTIRPPVPTMTNIAYISQNGGDLSTSQGRSRACPDVPARPSELGLGRLRRAQLARPA